MFNPFTEIVDSETTDTEASGHAHDMNQEIAVRKQRRLKDRAAGERMFPEHLAVGRCDTGCPGFAQ